LDLRGRKWQEVEEDCKNEELHNVYTLPNVINVVKLKMRWVGHVAHMEEMRNAYKIVVIKPEGKGPLGRHMQR
jgi:hypothetical protein